MSQGISNGDDFSYYLMTPSDNRSQSLLIPYYKEPITTRTPVYVKFDKFKEGTSEPLPGCTFVFYDSSGMPVKTHTTISGPNVVELYLEDGVDSETYTVIETKPAPGYTGNAQGAVTVSKTANATPATAALISGSPFINNVPPPPSSDSPVLKKDADSGVPLAGAIFRFTGAGGVGYDRTTGSDGGVTIAVQWWDPTD